MRDSLSGKRRRGWLGQKNTHERNGEARQRTNANPPMSKTAMTDNEAGAKLSANYPKFGPSPNKVLVGQPFTGAGFRPGHGGGCVWVAELLGI